MMMKGNDSKASDRLTVGVSGLGNMWVFRWKVNLSIHIKKINP